MSPGIEVHPGRIRAAADRLTSITEEFRAAVRAFQARVDGFGEPWGGDEIGMIIGAAHQSVWQVALRSFETNAAELAEQATDLRTVAANHDTAERRAEVYVNKVRDLL